MRKYLIVFLILGASILFVVYSCSMVGLGIGAAIDARKTRSIAGWEVFELPKDAIITVYNKKGAPPVRGKFKGGAMANPALDTAVNVVLIEVPGKQIRDIPVSDINYIAVKQKTNTARSDVIRNSRRICGTASRWNLTGRPARHPRPCCCACRIPRGTPVC